MQGNASLSSKQRRLITLLFQGSTIVDAAKQCQINESTAHRWLNLPDIQAERKHLETLALKAEQDEIARVLATGYAAMHRRVEALDRLADKLEAYMEEEKNIWLPDVKGIGTGESAERVDLVRFNDALISEYRATFADLAAELGHRVKKTKQEITGKDGKPIQTQQVEIYKVRLPDNERDGMLEEKP